MAHIATIKILLDDKDTGHIEASLNEMLATAQQPVEGGQKPWLVDWTVEAVDPVANCIAKAVADGTYSEGQMAGDLVLFSAAEAIASGDGAAFWSNEYGWTTLDLATRFDASCGDTVRHSSSRRFETVWMGVPDGLSFYEVQLMDEGAALKFHCWAESHEHAKEQAQDAYNGCTIVSNANVFAGELEVPDREAVEDLAP
jgi:hypothetical protein